MKPGPKPLPYTARRVERVILNLYPAEHESLTAAAFDRGLTVLELARHAFLTGLQQMIDDAAADDFINELVINNRHNS